MARLSRSIRADQELTRLPREDVYRAKQFGIGSASKTGIVTDSTDDTKWTTFHFSQSNPLGEGQGSVPALLRRVADSIDRLGDVDVHDLVFHSVVGADEDDLTITVYYDPTPRRR